MPADCAIPPAQGKILDENKNRRMTGSTSVSTVKNGNDLFRTEALNAKNSLLFPSDRGIIPSYAGNIRRKIEKFNISNIKTIFSANFSAHRFFCQISIKIQNLDLLIQSKFFA